MFEDIGKSVAKGALKALSEQASSEQVQKAVAETAKASGTALVQGVVAGLKGVSFSDAAQVGAKVGVGVGVSALVAYGVYQGGIVVKNKVSNYLYGQ
jgi:hypothetical protein